MEMEQESSRTQGVKVTYCVLRGVWGRTAWLRSGGPAGDEILYGEEPVAGGEDWLAVWAFGGDRWSIWCHTPLSLGSRVIRGGFGRMVGSRCQCLEDTAES